MKFNIINIQELDSTVSYAQRQIENGKLHEGDVVFTLTQEQGRGQGDNFWESEPDSNLLISIILEPKMINASQQFILTQLVSNSIIELIKEYVNNELVKIKWPNDIYINNKKIAGILFQNFIKGDRIEYSIAGIGINVNQKKFFSDAPNPISLIHYTQKQINLVKLLTKLLDKIGNNYDKFIFENNHSQLKSVYIDNLYRFGEWAIFSDLNSKFNGKIIDIDNYGRLIVELISGEKRKYMFKEIEFTNDQ
jgi:BirA family biotin operon repressor/biotin-[acetyl-CoA-carboxylase] ligase